MHVTRFPDMQARDSSYMPDGGPIRQGLREVGMPHADAGLRNALRSAFAPCPTLPPEFSNLLDRLR